MREPSRPVGRSSSYYLAATTGEIVIALVWAALSYHLLEVRFIRSRPASPTDAVPARELTRT